MIVTIAGPTASGKTTVADALERDFDAKRLRYSILLADIARERGLDPDDKSTLQQLYLSERDQRGEDFLAQEMALRIKYTDAPLVVVEGARRVVDIPPLRRVADEREEKLKLIFIEAAFEARFARYNDRLARAGEQSVTRDVFEVLERNAAENEIDNLREMFEKEGLFLDTSSMSTEETMKKVREFLGL